MKILHFSTWQTGGAAKAATRLSDALVELGHDSKVIHMTSKLPAYFDAAIGKLTQDNNPIFHSYNYFPDNFRQIIKRESPDIIHLHWIGAGFVRPESLKDCPIPIVWTLHDLWPLLGAEHLPLDTSRMIEGYLASNRPIDEKGLDLNKFVWDRKNYIFAKANTNFISPSSSNFELAKKAKLMNRQKHVHIPNFIDDNVFKPISSQIEPFTIFFPAMNVDIDTNKGMDLLFEALSTISLPHRHQFKLIIAGSEKNLSNKKLLNIDIKSMGVVSDEKQMANLYQRAAVCVVPSRMENLPYTALESLSCGTPVVAFNVGGISELVIHNKTGYLAKPYDTKGLASGIAKILSDKELRKRLSSNGIIHVKRNFSKDIIVNRHLELYNSLLNR